MLSVGANLVRKQSKHSAYDIYESNLASIHVFCCSTHNEIADMQIRFRNMIHIYTYMIHMNQTSRARSSDMHIWFTENNFCCTQKSTLMIHMNQTSQERHVFCCSTHNADANLPVYQRRPFTNAMPNAKKRRQLGRRDATCKATGITRTLRFAVPRV